MQVFEYYPHHLEAFMAQTWSQKQLNQVNEQGWTLLMMASLDNQVEWVKTLVALGVDMDLKNPKGEKAVILAANAGHDKVMIHLLLTGSGG